MNDDDMPVKIEDLITNHAPWHRQGELPPRPANGDERRHAVETWIQSRVNQCRPAAVALIAGLGQILDSIRAEIERKEGKRFVARIDETQLLKSPTAVLEKMARSWTDRSTNPPISFENIGDISDLARFRIVVNFLSDLERVASDITRAYGVDTGLSPAQRELRTGFRLVSNNLDNSVHLSPGIRIKGERCCKGVFSPTDNLLSQQKIEVQIQTQLEEAWDKKDHYLIYEPRRRGDATSTRHVAEMFAMSELLYVADLTFDRLRESIITNRLGGRQDA